MNLKLNDVIIEDTFAEAFPMYATRILITAINSHWALISARVATGFGSSVIACPGETGIEALVSSKITPDFRPGVVIQIYHNDPAILKLVTLTRIGQCILTAPTTAAFNGLTKSIRKMSIGKALAKFGDGFEKEDVVGGRKVWRIPVMEGEFVVEDYFGIVKGVAGGNILILAKDVEAGLNAAEKAVKAIRRYVKYVITPFPGGIVRSGSKVGSLKYPKLRATTNHPYCPTLKGVIKDSRLPPEVNSVYEIVINGLRREDVLKAMGIAIKAAASVPGIVKIDAGNYGGRLGPYHLYLKEALEIVKNIEVKI
ncbi:MAG: formylmethanofuran--tetrahydromethanopterin N-formyltransferase [Candidatus Methanomethylicia archaeon]|nr:formylmethanofuran--tetrahydromethanopterin N-formyltransferase [Candidatus Methanomethylicia archaeon]MCX8168907.1 formylmethanofuran--tetrahydromethanopterin N-formyltransferase [Candidatus Methanomethylicia archaeon]MDW7988639.1 formylmethanofuran--tetrahydromethanopterin N-formyltransferase [Nitrososphaerota archaeon]